MKPKTQPSDEVIPTPAIVSPEHPYLRALGQAFAHVRLDTYRYPGDTDHLDAAARYLWNIALCEAWYPTLNMVEVAVRNRINAAMTAEFPVGQGSNGPGTCWLDAKPSVLAPKEERLVEEVLKSRFVNRGIGVTQDKLVAEMNLGFWTSLFDRRYEDSAKCPTVLWPRLASVVFPLVPRPLQTRRDMSRHLETLRYVRNRAFHYESLVKPSFDVKAAHTEVVGFFGWLRPALLPTLIAFDRFPEVYAAGTAKYRTRLEPLGEAVLLAAKARVGQKLTREQRRAAKAVRKATGEV